MADYTLKQIDKQFWQRVKAHAALKGVSIKQLIINLLISELLKGK